MKIRFAANVNTPADAPKAVAALKGKADIITLNEDCKGDFFKAVADVAHASRLSTFRTLTTPLFSRITLERHIYDNAVLRTGEPLRARKRW